MLRTPVSPRYASSFGDDLTPARAWGGCATGPRPTTFVEAPRLSSYLGVSVVLATEAFQWTGSFKFRAAYNVATHIREPAVIAASSGNFGQALALACSMIGKRCTIVMPHTSARVKIEAVRAHGAEIDLVDVTVTSRASRVAQLSADSPTAYVASSHDDPLVIQGNASLGRELGAYNRLSRPFDAVLVPVGGGGLAAGVLTGLRDTRSATPVWCIEPAIANDFAQSLAAGRIVTLNAEPATIADGARNVHVGQHPWAILSGGAAGALVVSEDAIRESVRLLFALANVKAEPTGALALAGLVTHRDQFRGGCVCCVVSGGNVDPALYGQMLAEC